MGALLRQQAFAFDTETMGDNRGEPTVNRVSWLSFAAKGIGCTIPMGHPLGEINGRYKEPRADKTGKVKQFWVNSYSDPPPQLEPAFVWETVRPLFFSESIIKIADDITFDIPTISKYFGEVPPPPYDDPKVTDQLLDENLRQYGLKERTKDLFGIDYDKEHVGRCVEKWAFSKVARYSLMDANFTWLRWLWGEPQLAEEGLTRAHQVEKALMSPLIGMRLAGAPVNVKSIEELNDTLGDIVVELEGNVYKAAGVRFNINSTQQKQQIIYGKGDILIKDSTTKAEYHAKGQGLRPWKLTGAGHTKRKAKEPLDWSCYSTDKDALNSYEGNPVVDALLEYQQIHTLRSTFVQSWLGEGSKKERMIFDSCIHTHFKQYGTVTGRLSSASPNLQNIPRPSSKYGKLLRGVFEAPPGWMLIPADYGQIELVVLAHLLGYGALFEGFQKGIDPHLVHAAGVLDRVPILNTDGSHPEGVLPDERQRYGKTLGFTIVNGAGPEKVGSMIGSDKRGGTELLEKYDRDFPETPAFKEAVFELARSRAPVPYVRTLIGRKRRVPELLSPVYGIRAAAERQTFNTLIQGGAADLIKLAVIEADRLIGESLPDAYLSLTVHDEIVAVAQEDQAEACKALLVEAMTGPALQRMVDVPLKVDAKVVKRWAQAK